MQIRKTRDLPIIIRGSHSEGKQTKIENPKIIVLTEFLNSSTSLRHRTYYCCRADDTHEYHLDMGPFRHSPEGPVCRGLQYKVRLQQGRYARQARIHSLLTRQTNTVSESHFQKNYDKSETYDIHLIRGTPVIIGTKSWPQKIEHILKKQTNAKSTNK